MDAEQAACETINYAINNSLSNIRIYLARRRNWVEDGDQDALYMMTESVQYLSQCEYDAVKVLGDVL